MRRRRARRSIGRRRRRRRRRPAQPVRAELRRAPVAHGSEIAPSRMSSCSTFMALSRRVRRSVATQCPSSVCRCRARPQRLSACSDLHRVPRSSVELQRREPRVQAAARDQLGVRAGLDDLARPPCTTMRSARCTVASRCAMTSVVRSRIADFERGLHHALALGIERAGRLVEQQQRRVLQDRAGDRDALALAARQAHAALAEEGAVALGQRADEVVREGGRARPRPPRRRSRRAGRSGCSPSRRPRRSRCPAARCRCARAARERDARAPARRRPRRRPTRRRRSAAAAGTPCSCRRRSGRPARRSRRARRRGRSRRSVGVLRPRRVAEGHVVAAPPPSRPARPAAARGRGRRARSASAARAAPSAARSRRPRAAGRRRPRTAPRRCRPG